MTANTARSNGSPITFRLDAASGVPTYLQLVHQVEHALRLGYLKPGDQLPKVRDVVASLAINPNTVLKAYRELDTKGLTAGRPGQGTFVATVSGITSAGAITGYYFDGSGVAHGYVRSPSGTITIFDDPGAGTGASQGTYVGSINPKGEIASFFVDASNVYHGYLRTRDGAITTLDAPGAGTGATQGTQAENINSMGAIVGNYLDASSVNHGFLRTALGTFITFDAPGAGTGPGQGTTPFSNNSAGEITGFEIDASGVFHGFLRISGGE